MNVIRSLRLASIASLLVLLFTTVAQAQTVTVTGTVTDTSGEPVIGATVAVVGVPGKGATADLDGNFTIPAVPVGATLRISFVGMKTQEITLENGGGQNNPPHLNIVLVEDSELLDEVVVVGYGTQKKANLTGAVSQIDSKVLEARPVQNVGQALQGVVPGLNFNVTNSGGALDSRMALNIRGTGTIGKGSSSAPLVLIDGSEGDIYSLAPNDIESISVLKDASASAIYGSRAAFGVILVTTKSGKEGKARISYNGNVRFATATQIPEMMDSYEFARYWNAAARNKGDQLPFDDNKIRLIKGYQAGTLTGEEAWGTVWRGYSANEPWGMYTDGWANTDWFAEMYKKNVPSQEHNISVSGGSDKIKYYVSSAILDQRGLIRHGKDEFRRYNLSGKITADLTSWLRLTYNNKWSREDYERPSYLTGLFFHNIARRWPTNIVYDPNGHYAFGTEILQMRDGGLGRKQTDRLNQQVTIEIMPLEGWVIRAEGNYNTLNAQNHWDVLPIYYYDPDQNPVAAAWSGDYSPGKSRVSESFDKNNYFNGRFYSEYAKIFDEKHDFKVVAGLDMEANERKYLSAWRDDLITPDVPTINTATHKDTHPGYGNNHWSTMGAFARVNYAYDGRYLLEASIRRDGSSRFIGDKTWATFPSFSLGWNIAQEEFFKPLNDYIGMLKLRGSWGTLGNTRIDALYPWFLSQPVGSKNSRWLIDGERQNTSSMPGLVSPDLTWETVKSWNIGLDFGLFNNRLQGYFDYFVRTTENMVGPAPSKPSILGADQPPLNNSDMRSQGWDLEISWRDSYADFRYGVKLVLSDDTQTVTRYYNPTGNIYDWYEGKKMGEIWGYQSVGIAKTDEEMANHLKDNKPSWGSNWAAGDVMYKNLVDRVDEKGNQLDKGEVNGGRGTLDDHGDLSIIGNSSPRYRFGITLDGAWKGLDASIFLQGIGKRDFWDNSPYSTGANHGMWQAAGFKEHLDFFRPEGDKDFGANLDAFYPRPLFDQGGKNFYTQTRYLQNAAYMRIKNLQIGYTLPAEWTSQLGVSRARIYFSGDNLYTFTQMNKIFDPEATGGDWGPGKIYPLARTISVGLNLNL